MTAQTQDKLVHQASISASLETVSALRTQIAQSPALALHLSRLKRYQADRLHRSYADLHAQDRYQAAVEFFTDDLYGDEDFSARDADLHRIVPAVARLFPTEAVATLDAALQLHALTETLDMTMCEHNAALPWKDDTYRAAWQATSDTAPRLKQLSLVLQVGQALDKLVHIPLIGVTLSAMKGPAAVAGLSELHAFLSRGFKAFKALKGANEFLGAIEQRERALIESMSG